MLVLADSLSFHGPSHAVPPTDGRLYTNVAAARLSADADNPWTVDLLARPGWTARDGWWAMTKDPVAWGVYLPRSQAVVLALGQMDQLPAALPTWMRESIPYIRPGSVRRRVRGLYRAVSPTLIRASDGRLTQLGEQATQHYLSRVVAAIRHYRPQLPIVRLLPAPYDADIYPSQRGHAAAVTAARRWCRDQDVLAVDLDPIVGPRLAAGENNPDGMHWGWQTHADIGAALAGVLEGHVARAAGS